MDIVEAEGESIDVAIENALRLLGVARDQISIEVVSEGRRGILGFGAQKARIRAQLRKPATREGAAPAEPSASHPPISAAPQPDAEIIHKAKEILEEILERIGVQAAVSVKPSPKGNETILDVQTASSGVLIGRKGQTLEALQYLVTRIVSERHGGNAMPHIVIDIENYRERRRRSLEDLALRLGEKAKRQRKTVTVDALSAADRRIVHAALQDDPWLSTKSLGQGAYRRLLIIPEGDRKTKEAAPPAKQGGKPSAKNGDSEAFRSDIDEDN